MFSVSAHHLSLPISSCTCHLAGRTWRTTAGSKAARVRRRSGAPATWLCPVSPRSEACKAPRNWSQPRGSAATPGRCRARPTCVANVCVVAAVSAPVSWRVRGREAKARKKTETMSQKQPPRPRARCCQHRTNCYAFTAGSCTHASCLCFFSALPCLTVRRIIEQVQPGGQCGATRGRQGSGAQASWLCRITCVIDAKSAPAVSASFPWRMRGRKQKVRKKVRFLRLDHKNSHN
jgi:hypothetical protein